MRQCSAAIVVLALCGLAAGCASVSLFESHHYHGTPKIEQRLDCLEKRVSAIEAGGNCGPAQPFIQHGPSPQFPLPPNQSP